MDRERIKEIRERFETMHREIMDSIELIEDTDLDTLEDERLGEFKHKHLYEFLPYREEIGGRIIFECIKENDKTYFNEKYRIYRKEDVFGIEHRDNPAYVEAVGTTIYRRIPPGCTILDVGCGTAKYLRTINSDERTVLAMDISSDLIEDNKRADGLERINFFAGDLNDLSPFRTGELDYVTGVNILNVLSVENAVLFLTQARRIAKRGLLFAFTLPTQVDFWTQIPKEDYDRIISGLNNPSAMPDEKELATRQTFEGQMNLFVFMTALCRQKDWKLRIFRFLDSYTMDWNDFLSTDDSRYIGYGNNALFKFLEYPNRRATRIDGLDEKKVLIHAVGYGMEVYFGKEDMLEPVNRVFYFDEGFDFTRLTVKDEMNSAMEYWKLPFERIE